MDFPKSVEGVGLVGGRFIDENPVSGQQGSLIVAKWANQIMDELFNIMSEAKKVATNPTDFDPSEEKSNQIVEAIKVLITDSIPDSLSDWKDIENKPTAITALTNIVTVNTTTTLTNAQLGMIFIDASASDVALTLPQANNTNIATKVTLFRLDNSTNKVTIKSATGETIYFNTKWNANGYGFFYLMGAGDYWQITSNGNKGWFKFDCCDSTSIGSLLFNGSINIPAGGWILGSGTLLSRSEYPWLWDYAQQSGMFVDDSSRTGFEGCWTNGDGISTFRTPDIRSDFLRPLDSGRGIDIDRLAGSWQADEFKSHTHDITPMSPENAATQVGIVAYSQRRQVAQTTEPTGGDETRPRNTAYPLYIKII